IALPLFKCNINLTFSKITQSTSEEVSNNLKTSSTRKDLSPFIPTFCPDEDKSWQGKPAVIIFIFGDNFSMSFTSLITFTKGNLASKTARAPGSISHKAYGSNPANDKP